MIPLCGFAQELIERIDIVGNDRVTRDTIMYYLSIPGGGLLRPGNAQEGLPRPLVDRLFRQHQNRRGTGRPGQDREDHRLEENPVIQTITYKTGKKVKEDDINTKLKEKDEFLLPYSYYSPAKLQRVKKTIEDLLAEKGLGAAKVEYETEKKGNSEIEVLFKIDEGPKVRIAEILFVGSPKLPQSTLREALKENKPHSLLSWVEGKDAYKQAKIADDLAEVKKALQENGYMEAVVGEPKVEEVDPEDVLAVFQEAEDGPADHSGRGRIPVQGRRDQGRGEQGLPDGRNPRPDQVSKRARSTAPPSGKKASRTSASSSGTTGTSMPRSFPVETLDPKAKVVNVTYQIAEGEICFLRRLDFKGNVFTKDKVIRREILLREGDVFRLRHVQGQRPPGQTARPGRPGERSRHQARRPRTRPSSTSR